MYERAAGRFASQMQVFTLPFYPKHVPERPIDTGMSSPPHKPGAGMSSVLVVEDDDALRRVLSRGLAHAGFSVCEAANGREATQALEGSTFDLVVTDLFMPEQDGIETLMLIRSKAPQTRIIVTSGYAQQALLGDALRLGAHRVLAKPFTPSELVSVARGVLAAPVASQMAQ